MLVVGGWRGPNRNMENLRILLEARRRREWALLLAMDTPWLGTARQRLALPFLRTAVQSCDAVVVPGERAFQYARRLGFAERAIFQPLYGVGSANLQRAAEKRKALGFPRRFIFIGRLVEEKGIRTLVAAYAMYRRRSPAPWPLRVCGTGPLEVLLGEQEGVEVVGFVEPAKLPLQLAEAAVFVIPSVFDPWPLALVEACASGLAVIASRACGVVVECVRDDWNGFVVPTGDSAALCEAMLRAEASYPRLPEMGERSIRLAEPYSANNWARRWDTFLRRICEMRRGEGKASR